MRDVAHDAVGELLDRMTGARAARGAQPPRELPRDNRETQVRITMVGAEQRDAFSMNEELAALENYFHVEQPPMVLALETEKMNEYLVILQFVVTLQGSAAQAVDEAQRHCASLVDGHSVLAYRVDLTGVL